MSDSDYRLFEQLVKTTQNQLHKVMATYLTKKYKNIIITKDYIVAIGDIPIALVAHMDTVFDKPVRNLYYDRQKGVLWSPEGLGADDRAGVFSIIKILQSGLRPSVILTTDEEIGGLGASALSEQKCPINDLKYMIELDRRGSNDCVFYCCNNPTFIKYISNFGFIEKKGSFSDISYLMSGWKICGVNLSVGYSNEHNYIETLHAGSLYDTIKKVKNILIQKDIPNFTYQEDDCDSWYLQWFKENYNLEDSNMSKCSRCKRILYDYQLFPVTCLDGSVKEYCPDCITAYDVEWCRICGEPFEKGVLDETKICTECKKNISAEE